jgi:hypothetical protein
MIDKRANLAKLAAYLTALPVNYAAFSMDDFLQPVSKSFLDKMNEEFRAAEAKYALENGGVATCGAVACAIGHGPTAGILALPEHIRRSGVDWFGYSNTFFLDSRDGIEFEWMFGGAWAHFDNTHHGAAKRIRYYLEHDVPRDFVDSTEGEQFLSLYEGY